MKIETSSGGSALDGRIMHHIADLSEDQKQQLLDLLIEWQKKEQRRAARIPCLIAVDYATKKRVYRDFMHDLSKGGVFIETREPFNIGETLSLTFSLPKSQNHIKIAGKIVHNENDGIGVEFDNTLSADQERLIKAQLEKNV